MRCDRRQLPSDASSFWPLGASGRRVRAGGDGLCCWAQSLSLGLPRAREPAAAIHPLQLGCPCSHGGGQGRLVSASEAAVAWQQAGWPLVLGRREVRLSFEALGDRGPEGEPGQDPPSEHPLGSAWKRPGDEALSPNQASLSVPGPHRKAQRTGCALLSAFPYVSHSTVSVNLRTMGGHGRNGTGAGPRVGRLMAGHSPHSPLPARNRAWQRRP